MEVGTTEFDTHSDEIFAERDQFSQGDAEVGPTFKELSEPELDALRHVEVSLEDIKKFEEQRDRQLSRLAPWLGYVGFRHL